MTGKDKFDSFIRRNNVRVRNWVSRPDLSRRRFFELAGAGVTGSLLTGLASGAVRVDSQNVTTKNAARNVVFILLAGAPSHIDLFDFKMVDGVTPASFQPETIDGIVMPVGLLPKLAQALPDYAVIRSMRSWAAVHSLAQTWTQIGRNPTAALGDIAPSIGSIVAIEKEAERKPSDIFPTFLALNSALAAGPGYLPAEYGPFKVTPATTGIRGTANPDGETRLKDRWNLLEKLDGEARASSPYGKPLEDYADFYAAARGLMYNPVVDSAFRYTAAESVAYGNSGLGNACLVASKVLKADQGTRFIQITSGGWDMHANIYADTQLPRIGKQLDDAVSQLIADLKASGLYGETLLVMAGEFGRTVGRLSAQAGRDHFLQQFCVVGGAGVRGGRTIGSTNEAGSFTAEYGWARERDIRPEDIEATIYSALGINWTSVRYDDPFGRGFEYVPSAAYDLYGPVNELWA